MTTECPVCYDSLCNTKVTRIICGHIIHTKCLREWYVRSEADPTCPMCRGPLLFKGISKTNWEPQNEDTIITDYIEKVLEEADTDWFTRVTALDVISEAQILYNTATKLGCDPDEIDWLLWDSDDWISPKRVTRNGKFKPDFLNEKRAPKNTKRFMNKKQRWRRFVY